jgi:hypothetical protein
VKYWQIIIENFRNAGWSCGSMATTDNKGPPIWVAAAEREGAGRFITKALPFALRSTRKRLRRINNRS